MTNSRAIVFAAIAAVGTAALLWSGYSASGREQERQHGEAEQREHELSGQAYESGEYDAARSLQQRGAILSLEQILERARRHHDGRVLETELEQKGERYVYEIELVDQQGRVWEMKFDAGSGELLKEKRED